VGIFLGALGPSAPPVPSTSPAVAAVHLPMNDEGANLTIDPPSFWMRSGSNLTLRAVWLAASPECRILPLWYAWSTDERNVTGFLNSTIGPTTSFTADSFDTGTVTVAINSGALLDCGTGNTVINRSSAANVSIVASFSLSCVELGPNPIVPGETALLQGTIVGGEPPYQVEIAWGDGTNSLVVLRGAGPFSIGHGFPAGQYVPTLLATDSGGDVADTSVDEALSVGSGLEVAVIPAYSGAEVGVPTEFAGLIVDPPPGAITLFDCSNATEQVSTASPLTSNETSFSCTFTAPGTAEVLFGAYSPRPGGPTASIVLYESVDPRPSISVGPNRAVGEVSGVAQIPVVVKGGVFPISLAWNLSGNRSGGDETLWTGGGGVLSFSLPMAGDFAIGARVSDALGSVSINDTASIRVDPALESNASGDSTLRSYGAVAAVDGSALSGCLPYAWWVVPSVPPGNESAENGTLENDGGFGWTGFYPREGTLSVQVVVADSCGVTRQSNLAVALVSLLSAEVTAAQGSLSPEETLLIGLSIDGGLPPFHLYVNASDNESWNRTLPTDGRFGCIFPSDGNQTVRLNVALADLLGRVVRTNLSVVLTSPPAPGPPPPPAAVPPPPTAPISSNNSTSATSGDLTELLAFVLVPLGVAGTFLVLRRRRARVDSRDAPRVDPEAVLKGIIEPADGAERFTVELLAEEAGVPLGIVRSTIDRLVTERKVFAESGADGEEVLSWSHETGR